MFNTVTITLKLLFFEFLTFFCSFLFALFLEHLVEMLNFNLPEGPNRPVWKLFIMDTGGQKILAPLIKVNDLREHGVTLFLQLKAPRERVPDVPAVYFVEPSIESISRICQV